MARLISLYSDSIDDAVVDSAGNFTLYAWRISPYKLWILAGGKRLAERDVEIDFLSPRDAPPMEINLSKTRPPK